MKTLRIAETVFHKQPTFKTVQGDKKSKQRVGWLNYYHLLAYRVGQKSSPVCSCNDIV